MSKWRNRIVRYEDVDPQQLLANPANWRIHPQAQKDALAGSIAEVGYVDAIKVQDGTDVVVDGHLRVAMALQDEQPTIPVQYVDLNDAEVALVLAFLDPITAMATADREKLAALLDELSASDQRLQSMLDQLAVQESIALKPTEGLTDPDDVPTVVEPITKPGDLWLLGEHRLLCGDSTNADDVQQLMAGEKARLLVTDPPYGVDYVGGTRDALTILNDDLGEHGTRVLVRDAMSEAPLAPGAAFYIFAPSGNMELSYRLALVDAGQELRQVLAWVKQDFVLGHSDYHYRHESILYGWNGGASHYFVRDRTLDTVIDDDVDLATLSKAELLKYAHELRERQATTVLREDRPHASVLHPTMKPVALVRRLLNHSSERHDVVLDPFLGSGTTLIAAEQLNRTCYGMEIDPHYCDVIVTRWQNFTGHTATLEAHARAAD